MITKKVGRVLALAALAVSGVAFCGVSLAQQTQKPLTNQDVVTMLGAHKSEQFILTAMRTQPAKFDVSNQARAAFDRECATITHPGVSTGAWATEVKNIWDTMTNVVICQETNGRGGEDACGPPTPPSKVNGRNEYESVTLERGVTPDKNFANWANSGQASTSPHELPALPPPKSNPKRDAAGPADAATRAEIKRKLEAQITAFNKNGPHLTKVTIRPVEKNIREVELLKRQKMFVEALRKQGVITPLKAGGQLGANSRTRTMSATQPPQTSGQMIMGSAPAPMAATPAGSGPSRGGAVLLGGGSNASGSKTLVPSQTVAPAGSVSSSGGALLLGGGTSQGNLKTVAPSQRTVALVGSTPATGGTLQLGSGTNQVTSKTVVPTITAPTAPAMRPAPASAAGHPVTPSSPIDAANSLNSVRLAAGSVSGYILWDTSTVHYQLSTPCQGLKVTISIGSTGSLQTLASSTSFTTPWSQPVWNFSGQGSQGPWMLCSYAFFKVPEEVPLEVDAVVTQPSAFTSPVSLPPMQKNQFKISGGNCASTPQSTLGVFLNSGTILCGDSAFNVNFAGLNSILNAALTNTNVCLGTQIYTVNGVNSTENASNPVVFTQDPTYNDYIITGCGFGTGEGGQVYLSGAVTGGHINMTVLQWSPTQIEAVVQRGLTGVLDGWPDLIVVPPGGGAPGKFSDCRFYAQRQDVFLTSIPRSEAHLVNVQAQNMNMSYCPSVSPGAVCGTGWYSGPSLINMASGVDRNTSFSDSSFSPGEDVYDIQLAEGFVIDGAAAFWYAESEAVCQSYANTYANTVGDSFDYSTNGRYDFYLKGDNEVVVDWGVDHCAWRWMLVVQMEDYYGAGYSLQVTVKGPIGVDPRTGQPVSQ